MEPRVSFHVLWEPGNGFWKQWGKKHPSTLVRSLQCLCCSFCGSWIQGSRQGVKLPCHWWVWLWRQYLHRNMLCMFFNEKKVFHCECGPFLQVHLAVLALKWKQRLLSAPHVKSLWVFSPLALLRVRHSHSIWLRSVEAIQQIGA